MKSTKSIRKGDAQNLLTDRLGAVQRGVVVTPKIGKITLGDGLKAVISDLRMNGRKGIADTQRRIDRHIRTILTKQFASVETLRQQGTIVPFVFHRPDGSRIRDFRKTWRKACEIAGYPGKLFHGFRRTAVRNLERAGVRRSTAMAMVGHQTESIYRRYAIVDEAMHREAAERLDAWAGAQKAKADAAKAKGQVRQFKKAEGLR